MAAGVPPLRLPALPLPLEALASPRRCPQQLEQFRCCSVAQVLPCPLPRHIPSPQVSTEFVHQQPHNILMVVDGGDVQRGIATARLGIDVKGQTSFFSSVPERKEQTPLDGGLVVSRVLKNVN